MFTAPMTGYRAATAKHRRRRAYRGFGVIAGLTALFAISQPRQAHASPALEGTRNLAMSGGRASASGSNAALGNVAAQNFQRQFTIEPVYQFAVKQRQHGIGAVAMDSLLNARLSVSLGYIFMTGQPQVSYLDANTGTTQDLELSTYGHEAFLGIGVMVVKQWVSLGLKPKYQYNSLRYLDQDGIARDAHKKLNTFGLDTALMLNLMGWVTAAVTVENVVGSYVPAYTSERPLNLQNLPYEIGSIRPGTLSPLSGYPLLLTHSVAVYPLHKPNFSLNFDGTYDFTSYKDDEFTRMTFGGSGEFIIGPVPLRFGTIWDSRGRGREDDRVYVSGGIGYIKPAKLGRLGVDAGFGFRQQVTGSNLETIIGLNIGLRLHPDF